MDHDEFLKRLEAQKALIGRMGREGLSKEEGEQIAEEGGIGPLQTIVDPNDYDPLDESVWTLTMTLAWIMSRDANFVRSFWAEFCRQNVRLHHRYETVPGPNGRPMRRGYYELKQDTPTGIEGISMIGKLDAVSLLMPRESAQKELVKACLDQQLEATGENTATNELEPVSLHLWRGGEIRFHDTGFNLEPYVSAGPLSRGFQNITFSTRDVLRIWPPILPASAKPRSTTIASETQCGKHLLALMQGGSSPEKNKRDYQDEMTAEFDISIRAFQRQWSLAIEKTGNTNWNKSGPKSPVRDSVSKHQ
ncbi:hypothetical protein [Labrenzia sp. DG1229]|uniref:hypothetical protein n=1 Tax=Labrenzia sp. DG1229 TaxID=681847 RepID=UPI00048DD073|nr:hypothetical protein [Labrenzia sp. DG1229]